MTRVRDVVDLSPDLSNHMNLLFEDKESHMQGFVPEKNKMDDSTRSLKLKRE